MQPFLQTWSGSALSLRIGLLTAAEEALEDHQTLLDDIVPDLIGLLSAEDASLRGDTADLLGRIGHRAALGALRKLTDDPHPDVAEIATEVYEEIAESGRD